MGWWRWRRFLPSSCTPGVPAKPIRCVPTSLYSISILGKGLLFPEVVRAAHDVRDRLQQLGLTSFCRTTGGKGLHVVVPIAPEQGWDAVKPFCRAFAEMLSEEQPERFLPTLKKIDRRGRILLDWLRNGLGATAVASFCPRARPNATVATPLSWDEVTAQLDPQSFTLQSVPQRLTRLRGDPWRGFHELHQPLPAAARESSATQRPRRPEVARAQVRYRHRRQTKAARKSVNLESVRCAPNVTRAAGDSVAPLRDVSPPNLAVSNRAPPFSFLTNSVIPNGGFKPGPALQLGSGASIEEGRGNA